MNAFRHMRQMKNFIKEATLDCGMNTQYHVQK